MRVIVIRASLVLVVDVGVTVLAVALGWAVGLYVGRVKDALDDWQTSARDDRFPTIRQTLHQVMHPQ